MKKRKGKKIAGLISLVVILALVIGFLSVFIAYDFDFTKLFGISPFPVPGPVIEDPEEVPPFSFQGDAIEDKEELGAFVCNNDYLFTVPFKDFSIKILADTSSASLDFFVDEGLYNLAVEGDIAFGFDLEIDDYSVSLSYVSIYQVLKNLYPDNEISFLAGETDKNYSFTIEFTDNVSGSVLTSEFTIFVSSLQSIELEDIEF